MDINKFLNSDSLIKGIKSLSNIQFSKPDFSRKKIQSMTEGQKQSMNLENLLFATSTANKGIGGVQNVYQTYDEQVAECYRKYNAQSDWGVQQTRAVIDIRSSFISGEGLSINSEDDPFIKWLENFTKANKLMGSRFHDMVLGTEFTGKALLNIKVKIPGDYPTIIRIPYTPIHRYTVKLSDKHDPSSIKDIVIKKDGIEISLGLSNFVYIRTGGDDVEVNATTTKTGVVLTDLENYDRAQKDMRRLNFVLARITPTFETKDQRDTDEVVANITKSRWKIGKAYVGTAKFKYETPGTGAHDNLLDELSTTIKTISSVTGIPVHWIGWTDLMSNRSTADSLYDLIDTATVRERTLIAEGIYDLIIKAQELYINSGGTDITVINREFEVAIPVIDRSQFLDTIRALSLAYNDGVISKGDYQNNIVGIDPIQTNKNLEAEAKQQQNIITKTKVPEEEEDE